MAQQQGVNPDPLDVGGNQYPLSSVSTAAGTFLGKTEHMENLTSGRIVFATFPGTGTTSGIHLADNRITDFDISVSGVQLCNELGILFTATATVVASADVPVGGSPTAEDYNHGISDFWWFAPTPYWVNQYEIYYGGSQMGTYKKEFIVYDVFRHLDIEEYMQYAEVLLLDGNVKIHSQDGALTGAQDVAPCAFNYSATDAVQDYQLYTDHQSVGQYACVGKQMPNFCIKGAGVPLSNTFVAAQTAGQMSTQIYEEWLQYASLRTWRQNNAAATVQVNSGNQSRQLYYPIFNYISQENLWMPGLNQRIRTRIYWSNQINSIPINADKLIMTNIVPKTGQFNAAAGTHALRVYNGILPLDGSFPSLADATQGTKGNQVRLRRADGNTDLDTTIDGMWLKGYAYNPDVAASISDIYSSQTVASRTTIPKTAFTTVPYQSWNANQVVNDTLNVMSGLMDSSQTYLQNQVTAYNNCKAVYANMAQGLPINMISKLTMYDGSGIPYCTPNYPGILVQNFWQGCDLDRSVCPMLFSTWGVTFTPELRAVLEDGSKHGSQYMNSLWRTEVTPKYTRAATAPGTVFGSGADTNTYTYIPQAVAIGDNYATILQTAVGSYSINLS